MWVLSPREVALRERSRVYTAVHARHEEAKAAEIRRWVAEIDQITEAYQSRVARRRTTPGPD